MEKKEVRLYTEKEAADYYGWSLFTMREIRKSGKIDFIAFNGQTIRYTIEQLEEYKNRFLRQAA